MHGFAAESRTSSTSELASPMLPGIRAPWTGTRELPVQRGMHMPEAVPRSGRHAGAHTALMTGALIRSRGELVWFGVWLLVGAGYGAGLLASLSIGVPIVLGAVVGSALPVARRVGGGASAFGVISGFGLPLLYIAFINRGGPGTICTMTASSQSCVEEFSPWP